MQRCDDKHLFLAVDAGTTNIKVAIVTENGMFIDMEQVNAKVIMPYSGVCEMDMNNVWLIICEAVTALRDRNPKDWIKIEGVGVCAQGDGMWPIDNMGNPVRNAILWNDTRKASLEGLDMVSLNEFCLKYNTTPLFSGAAPILVRLIKNQEPNTYKKIFKVLHCKDWINYKLTGKMVTDVTDASTALLNIFTKKYEYRVLEKLGIKEAENMFPEVVNSHEIIGGISESAAAILGLKKGVPVIAGCIDVLSVAEGCGINSKGQKGSIIGTTLCNYVVLDEDGAKENRSGIGSVLCHTESGLYIRLMAALSGASSLDWVRNEILNGESFQKTEEEMKKIPTGSDGVLYHPYIYGERAPFAQPSASGGFYGLRSHHTKYNLAKAAYEGIVLSMYDCYQSLPNANKGLCIAGGATKSDLICQMVCDCMGEETYRYAQKELGILGVCNLICIALEINQNKDKKNLNVFTPNVIQHNSYMGIYKYYRNLREIMKEFWNNIGQ